MRKYSSLTTASCSIVLIIFSPNSPELPRETWKESKKLKRQRDLLIYTVRQLWGLNPRCLFYPSITPTQDFSVQQQEDAQSEKWIFTMCFFKTWRFEQKFSRWLHNCTQKLYLTNLMQKWLLVFHHLTLSCTTVSLLQGFFAQRTNSEPLSTDGWSHIFT